MSDPINTPAPVAAPTPKPTREEQFSTAFAEALKAEGIVDAQDASAAKATKPVETPPEVTEKKAVAEERPEGPPERTWEKLMQEKAALRRERESMRPHVEALQAMDPIAIQAVARAKANKDPIAALSALGFSYGDVTESFLAKREAKGAEPKEQEAEAPASKFELPAEIQRKMEFLEQREMQRQKSELQDSVKNLISESKDKFKLTAGMGEYPLVLRFIEDFYSRTGELPGKDFKESVSLAAEAVERHLTAESKRWSGVLTPHQQANTVPAEAQREQPAAAGSESAPGKTLTNKLTPPGTAHTEPKTRQERLDALLRDPAFLNEL